MEGPMAQKKGLWILVREKVLRERGALPEEEGDIIRDYKAMHEEIFLGSWLREEEKEERILETARRPEKRGAKREEEKRRKKGETESVKRRCAGSVSVEAFEIFSQG